MKKIDEKLNDWDSLESEREIRRKKEKEKKRDKGVS